MVRYKLVTICNFVSIRSLLFAAVAGIHFDLRMAILLCKVTDFSLTLTNCVFLRTSFVGSSSFPKARKAQNRIQIIRLGHLKVIDWALRIYIFH